MSKTQTHTHPWCVSLLAMLQLMHSEVIQLHTGASNANNTQMICSQSRFAGEHIITTIADKIPSDVAQMFPAEVIF